VRFQPKDEKQLAEEGMLPAGAICDFEVTEAEDAVSRAGNEMIALKLKVWRPNGSTMILRDWLVSTQQGKVLAFAKATGTRDAYDAGEFDARDLTGKCGKLKVGVEDAQGDFPARNKVASYIAADKTEPRQERQAPRGGHAQATNPLDDDIPF
jgi:hypothetical protein